MSVYLDASITIQKAASRVRGDRLIKLMTICEQQRSISTRRLAELVDELRDSDRMDGLHFKALADFLRKHNELCRSTHVTRRTLHATPAEAAGAPEAD